MGRRHSPASGRCPLLRAYVLRVGLCGFRDRRVLPENHRLADLHGSIHRPGPGRPGDGRLATKTSGADLSGLVHHLRPRRAVQVHPLRGRPGRVRGGRLCRLQGGPPFGFALAEALNSLYKAELILRPGALAGHRRRPWSPPPSGSTDTTTTALTATTTTTTVLQPTLRRTTTINPTPRHPPQRDYTPSTKLGKIHYPL